MPSESWLRRHSISYIGAFLDTLLPPKTVILPISIVLLFSLWGLAPTFALEKYGRPLPSMEQPDKTDQATEETLLGGYFLSAVFFKNPSFFPHLIYIYLKQKTYYHEKKFTKQYFVDCAFCRSHYSGANLALS